MTNKQLPEVGSTKLPEFRDFMKKFAQVLFDTSAEQGTCWVCGGETEAEDFRDEESLQAYGIYGMCQKCQDETFGGPAVLSAILLEHGG